MVFESVVEETIISLLQKQGYEFIETDYQWIRDRRLDEFVNVELLYECLSRINNTNDKDVLDQVINKITRIDNPSLFERNHIFHKYLINGITVDSKDYDINPLIKLIDYDNPQNNVFQVCHQVKFNEGRNTRIPDVIIYINGLPLIVMELKSFDEDATDATLDLAYLQLGSNSENDGYRYDIPTLFNYNSFLVISDGVYTKVGTLTSKFDRFNEWKSVKGEKGYDDSCVNKLNILIDGLFNHEHLLDIIKNNLFFIIDKNDKPIKVLTQYHQYFGVIKSIDSIKKALKPKGDGKAGIIWHTQGSGKSFSMVMLAHRLLIDPSLNVPTIVLLTDRIDLDDQLYKTFCSAKEFLNCEPTIAESRKDLLEKINTVKQGGIIFTTIAKFDKEDLPKNDRNNIIVMTDEAHRSHYGLYEKVRYIKDEENDISEAVFTYGIEKYIRDALPNATFIGFTGTPVSTKEKQTTDIFGEIIDVYDMTQSIIDGSTVKLYYESRLAKVWTDEKLLKQIDSYYDDLENSGKGDAQSIERSKAEMSKIKVILEDDDMISLFARDIIDHYEQRKDILNGKAMIVCQTRIAAAKMYKKIVEDLRPDYKDKTILVITESNKDPEWLRKLCKTKDSRKEMGEEFKKEDSKYKIAIVVDMWLTGFDVPDLDVMYFIKKIKAHNLMQAIARVNRVYAGKSSGLIVDYIGLDKALDNALTEYTDRDRLTNVQDIKKEIYVILQEKLSVLNEWFYKIDKSKFFDKDSSVRFKAIQDGAQFILEDINNREFPFINDLTLAVKQAFIVCGGIITKNERDDVMYYLAIRSYILKLRNKSGIVSTKEMNEYVSELLADAIKGDEVKVLSKTDNDEPNVIELLSPEKIKELREKNPPHVFVEIVKRLLEKAISESRKHNYFKSQEYSMRLRKILEKYNSRDLDFTPEQTIVDLVGFAGDIMQDEKKAEKIGVFGRERAFYDALIRDKSAQELMNDETLKLIAHELKGVVEEYASTDWANKESTRAKMRTLIKECLNKYHYPPDYQKQAVDDVIKQAEYVMIEE